MRVDVSSLPGGGLARGLLSLAAPSAGAGAQTSEYDRLALRAVSAGAIGVADTSSITVSGEVRAGARWTWKVSADGKTWTCDADDRMRSPSCVRDS
jgi:hypothetical protein